MTIQQVIYVVETAHTGSISKAARNLYVSQPALSSQILKLEKELGYDLLERTPGGVALTPVGKVFCEDAEPLIAQWKKLEFTASLLSVPSRRRFRLGLGVRAFSNQVFGLVTSLFEQLTDVEVSFVTDVGANMLGLLEEKKIDIAIDEMPPASMITHPDHFYASELRHERMCILLSPNDPRAKEEALSFEALKDDAMVCGPEGSLDDLERRMYADAYGIRIRRFYRSDNISTAMALVHEGRGVALGPASFAERYEVAAVPLIPEAPASVYLICLKDQQNDPFFLRLEDELKKYLAEAAARKKE